MEYFVLNKFQKLPEHMEVNTAFKLHSKNFRQVPRQTATTEDPTRTGLFISPS